MWIASANIISFKCNTQSNLRWQSKLGVRLHICSTYIFVYKPCVYAFALPQRMTWCTGVAVWVWSGRTQYLDARLLDTAGLTSSAGSMSMGDPCRTRPDKRSSNWPTAGLGPVISRGYCKLATDAYPRSLEGWYINCFFFSFSIKFHLFIEFFYCCTQILRDWIDQATSYWRK